MYQALNWDLNSSMPRLADDELFARPALKLLGRHFGYTCDDLLALALPALDGLVSVTHSNSKGLVEAAALGVSKATVVAELAAAHGIGHEAVIAFGDMPNDLPLLAWAGTSCAVANAHPEVLAAASHVIGSNDEDGVAEYLETLYPLGGWPAGRLHWVAGFLLVFSGGGGRRLRRVALGRAQRSAIFCGPPPR